MTQPRVPVWLVQPQLKPKLGAWVDASEVPLTHCGPVTEGCGEPQSSRAPSTRTQQKPTPGADRGARGPASRHRNPASSGQFNTQSSQQRKKGRSYLFTKLNVHNPEQKMCVPGAEVICVTALEVKPFVTKKCNLNVMWQMGDHVACLVLAPD
ncbi:hypothetical protein NDU88_002511 [Pleurodeles waltl]|uniref:Uncharacterized protein n=1 Tax=Pleurodeles waltl TaxID=8319 RepID=A0AAV7W222_PLEWA|nr:hypothetical protein NDU88_002511 [Pleurodeles waltl]